MKAEALTIKEKQILSLNILECVDHFCEKNDIRYYLAYGTLLGAVRHGGFIPWDDDIDIFMPRPDYQRFIEAFHDDNNEIEILSCYSRKDYVLPYAKVHSNKTKTCLRNGKILDHGLGIDVFPLDGVPEDIELAKKLFMRDNDLFINVIQRCDAFKFVDPHSTKDYIKKVIYYVSVGSGYLNRLTRTIAEGPYYGSYEECKYVASVVGIHSGVFRLFNKEWFEPTSIQFEGLEFTCPSGYDDILKMTYGDYLELPPMEKRITTHVADFIRME